MRTSTMKVQFPNDSIQSIFLFNLAHLAKIFEFDPTFLILINLSKKNFGVRIWKNPIKKTKNFNFNSRQY